MEANSIRANMASSAIDYGNSVGMPIAHDPAWFDKLALIRKSANRNKRLIDAVNSERLGLRFNNGDMDIMAPASMTADEVAEYQALGWIIIVSGIVVLAGVVAYITWLQKENEDLKTKFNNLLFASDKTFCRDPNSSVCQKWVDRKARENFEAKKGTIEQLESGIKSVAQTAKKGLGIGIAIAIPLVLWSLARKAS